MPVIKSYISPKAEVKEKSTIEGKGLFAKKDIKKGELIFIKSGHIITYDELIKLESEPGRYSLQIYDNFLLCPKTKEEVNDIAIFVNHSCDPNIGPDGQITFVALRDIKVGEELCYDYAMTTTHPSYKLKCKCSCGTKYCRGIITGNDWKLKELQNRYGDNFSYYVLKKIKANK